jgi:predicted HTH domain antitoxin
MRAVNIRELKNNPSEALRAAREDDFVVVMNRDEPQALLVDLTRLNLPDMPSVRLALAIALFGQGHVSLGYAARIAGETLPGMMEMLAQRGIPIVKVTAADLDHDLETISAARALAKRRRPRPHGPRKL